MKRRTVLSLLCGVSISGCTAQRATSGNQPSNHSSTGSSTYQSSTISPTSDNNCGIEQTAWEKGWAVTRRGASPVEWEAESPDHSIAPALQAEDQLILTGDYAAVAVDSSSGQFNWGHRYRKLLTGVSEINGQLVTTFANPRQDGGYILTLDYQGGCLWHKSTDFEAPRVKSDASRLYIYDSSQSGCSNEACRSPVTVLDSGGDVTKEMSVNGEIKELYTDIDPPVAVTTAGVYNLTSEETIASGLGGITSAASAGSIYVADDESIVSIDPSDGSSTTVREAAGAERLGSDSTYISYLAGDNTLGLIDSRSNRVVWEKQVRSPILDFDSSGSVVYAMTEKPDVVEIREGSITSRTPLESSVTPSIYDLQFNSDIYAFYEYNKSGYNSIASISGGRTEWEHRPGSSLYSPLITGDGVFVSSRDGRTWKLL